VGDEMQALADHFDETLTGYGRQVAVGYMKGQKAAVTRRYGEDLNANSHGESFLKLFESRLVPGGIYLLDEPEVPLSPLRQLALLSLIKQFAGEAQFVIATHSPILMAFPGATIYTCDGPAIREAPWDELEHVKLTRDFLKDPQAFLRHL
ncbi:MAG TPA: AAA family ATPase, partial [Oscillatoriaceae cyanobacterium]